MKEKNVEENDNLRIIRLIELLTFVAQHQKELAYKI